MIEDALSVRNLECDLDGFDAEMMINRKGQSVIEDALSVGNLVADFNGFDVEIVIKAKASQ